MSRMPFSRSELDNPEAEPLCACYQWFAEEVNISPIEFHAIHIARGRNDTSSKFLHSQGGSVSGGSAYTLTRGAAPFKWMNLSLFGCLSARRWSQRLTDQSQVA